MRNTALAATCVVIVCAAASLAQQGGRGAVPAAPAVPKVATGKTMFWPAADIEARWTENEALTRNNSRLFDGPTNISANVRIVAKDDPPLTHETTSDLWIVTAGTAVARTDGRVVNSGARASIDNGTMRAVAKGDILYVPPGVPHHFTEMNGFRALLIRFDTVGLERTKPAPAAAPVSERSGSAAAPKAATDRTMFWPAADIEARWQENERLKRINSRIFNGPANISANVRIVLPGDPPLTHEETADLWLVMAGEAVARTDGEIAEANGARTVRNGMSRPVRAGDILLVPPGVPHHFTDMKGFRAWLIRFDVEGWATRAQPRRSGAP